MLAKEDRLRERDDGVVAEFVNASDQYGPG